MKIRVFLADDHPFVLQGLHRVIDGAEDMVVVGSASDGRQALQALAELAWDVLILDLSLPRVSGNEVLRRVRAQHPAGHVIILSLYPEAQYAQRLLSEGASAYLSKDRPPEELLTAIRQVARGGAYLTAAQAAQLVQRPAAAGPPHARLSAREHQVFLLVIHGRASVEIAAELDLSTGTVSTHLHRIKEKLGVRSVAEIVSYAHRAGLVD